MPTAADTLTVRPLAGQDELLDCIALQHETWGADFSEAVPYAVLWFTRRIGGVLSGAFEPDGRLVGFVFGVTGWSDGQPVHWSDMLAVRRNVRDRGIGIALKRHQRELLLERGVTRVEWTFDPLESRNAYLNFARLGVVAREYLRDAYPSSDSPLHRGIATDRLVVDWPIDTERVAQRLDEADAERRTADDVADLPLVNPTALSALDLPVTAEPDLKLTAERVRIAIPADMQAVKRSAPAEAHRWRDVTRRAFEHYFGSGYEAVDVVRRNDRFSEYVLERR